MLERVGISKLRAVPSARWRSIGGLAIMLLTIGQSARTLEDPLARTAVWVLALVMSIAWLVQLTRLSLAGVWTLGGASCLLMLVAPGAGPAIGTITAIVTAGLRLPVRQGAITASVLGMAFVVADGVSSHWSNLTGTAFTALGLAFAYLATASVRRVREERERAEALLAELQQSRAGELERAALAERARIAREIHDVLAHTLSALAVQLEGTRMLVEQRPGDPAAVAAVERAHRLATEGLAEAKRAIGALRGDKLPGPEGLSRLVAEFSAATGTPGRFEVSGEPTPLRSEANLALFRTAQEALTNVRKHTAATSVEVRLRYEPEGAELLVEDAAPAVVPNKGLLMSGYGLLGMRERAELVGGTLEAGPLPTGFRVRLWLPKT